MGKDAFKKIGNYASHAEAEMMAELLKKAGIAAIIQSTTTGIFGPSAVTPPEGITLLVPEKDYQKALEILPYYKE